jgi:hypothetical protein
MPHLLLFDVEHLTDEMLEDECRFYIDLTLPSTISNNSWLDVPIRYTIHFPEHYRFFWNKKPFVKKRRAKMVSEVNKRHLQLEVPYLQYTRLKDMVSGVNKDILGSPYFDRFPLSISKDSDFDRFPLSISKDSDFDRFPLSISKDSDFDRFPLSISKDSEAEYAPSPEAYAAAWCLVRDALLNQREQHHFYNRRINAEEYVKFLAKQYNVEKYLLDEVPLL